MLHLTYVAAVILIPVVPAFLLYKYLPAGQAEVGGPFKGLDIKLSGAFAGYFLVLLIASSLLVFLIKTTPVPCPPCPAPPPNRYEVYTVSGKVDLRKSQIQSTSLSLSLMPAERIVLPNGTFRFDIPVKPGQGSQLDFPTMLISSTEKDVESKNISLKPGADPEYDLVYDHAAKTITIKSTLYLERRPKNVGESQEPSPLPQPSSQP